jgi:hypothetical protein
VRTGAGEAQALKIPELFDGWLGSGFVAVRRFVKRDAAEFPVRGPEEKVGEVS